MYNHNTHACVPIFMYTLKSICIYFKIFIIKIDDKHFYLSYLINKNGTQWVRLERNLSLIFILFKIRVLKLIGVILIGSLV